MTAPADGAQGWSPQPLPEDDVLAREPAPEDVADLVLPPLPRPGEPGPQDVVEAAPDAERVDDAGPQDVVEPAPDAEPAGDAAPVAGPTAAAGPSPTEDAELAEEEALSLVLPLLQTATSTPAADRRRWTGSLAGVVVVLFFLFAPGVLLAGNALPWFATYTLGGALAVGGGVAMGPDVLRRGTVTMAPLVCFAAGALLVLGCVVVAAVGAVRLAA